MKTKIFFTSLLFICLASFSFAQGSDSIAAPKQQLFWPGIKLGGNYTGIWTGESEFVFGLNTSDPEKISKITSTVLHGPALGCEFGNYENAFRVAPKFSYVYYSYFFGARISATDYMKGNEHNIYISPEAGISMTGFLNIFAGVNFLASGNEVKGIKMFRASVTIDLLFFYFSKDK